MKKGEENERKETASVIKINNVCVYVCVCVCVCVCVYIHVHVGANRNLKKALMSWN